MSLFFVALRFADRSLAPEHLPGHRAWIERGLDARAILLAGGLEPGLGGALLVTAGDRATAEALVAEDPFVEHGVVTAEILEIAPAQTDPRLDALRAL